MTKSFATWVMVAVQLALSTTLLGCGLWHRVDRDDLAKVPNEEKLLLFDAENGVFIAKDERLVAERKLHDAEVALERAEAYADVIDDRRSSGSSIDTDEVLSLLTEWNNARIELREAEIELAEQQLETAEARLWASRARYEHAKALLVKEYNPEEGSSIDIEDFVEQVKDREADEAEEVKLLEEREKAVSEARARYNALSTRLQAASKGAYGGPWADLAD